MSRPLANQRVEVKGKDGKWKLWCITFEEYVKDEKRYARERGYKSIRVKEIPL